MIRSEHNTYYGTAWARAADIAGVAKGRRGALRVQIRRAEGLAKADINGKADPYVVLGVPAGAPRPQLRKAYLALALQYHPDKNTNASASGAFAAISRAWKAVSSA